MDGAIVARAARVSVYSYGMADAALLHQVLSSAVQLRDKVLVVRAEAGALASEEQVAQLAATLALLRQLGSRVIVVLGPADAQLHGVRLMTAISRHGQRALLLPAAGVLTGNRQATAEAQAVLPVVVDQVLLGQLCSLGYVPLLLLPLIDESGVPISVSADEVTAAVALFLDAALLVFVRDGQTSNAPPLPVLAAGRRTVQTSADKLAALLSEVLLPSPTPNQKSPVVSGS